MSYAEKEPTMYLSSEGARQEGNEMTMTANRTSAERAERRADLERTNAALEGAALGKAVAEACDRIEATTPTEIARGHREELGIYAERNAYRQGVKYHDLCALHTKIQDVLRHRDPDDESDLAVEEIASLVAATTEQFATYHFDDRAWQKARYREWIAAKRQAVAS